jgi:hypothetical protein
MLRFTTSKPKLRKLLEFASIGQILDTVWLRYDGNGLMQVQVDPSCIIAVISKIRKPYFTEYQATEEGEVKMPSTLYNIVKEYFKEIDMIEFTAGDGKLSLHARNESYEGSLLNIELPKAEINVEERDYGLIPILSKSNITAIYGIDSEEWSLKADEIKISYGDTLKLTITVEEGGTYTRSVKILDKKGVTGSGTVRLDGKIFKNIVDLFSGPLYLIVTDGPIILAQKTPEYAVSYIVAPKVEE